MYAHEVKKLANTVEGEINTLATAVFNRIKENVPDMWIDIKNKFCQGDRGCISSKIEISSRKFDDEMFKFGTYSKYNRNVHNRIEQLLKEYINKEFKDCIEFKLTIPYSMRSSPLNPEFLKFILFFNPA